MKKPALITSQAGIIQHPVLLCAVLLVAVYGIFQFAVSHASAATPVIRSGINGYCLDVHENRGTSNTPVDSWLCNGTAAQSWKVGGGTIMHNDTDCLSVLNNGTSIGDLVVSNACDEAAGQVWLTDKDGYINPNSGLCLAVPQSQTGLELVLASCTNLSQPNETWTYKASSGTTINASTTDCITATTEGEKVACSAEKEWSIWQSDSPSHTELLNDYTNGYSYEEWCADFVSYVYKEAGFPFTGGESDGWDENIAANIQNMGFTIHPAASYIPEPGDVAYFNYPGGHVEIVVSGGKTPTFIYGNSSVIDPSTGNGEMATNTTANDSNGQVLYYLSPN